MKKSTVFAISTICLLFGIIFGFLLSPVKHGIGNDSGNTYNYDKKGEK
jgi:hypothetical protein